jgi:hypothetical protein
LTFCRTNRVAIGLDFGNQPLPKKMKMMKNCFHITISSMLLWRIDSIKSAVFLLGTPGADCEKGVFIDKDFFEPFYIPKLLLTKPKSKVIQLLNIN